ncbi:MAG: alpha/beta fold hydrolase [Thainema sp.]
MTTGVQTSSTVEWTNNKQDSTPKTLVFLHYFGGAATSWQWVAEQLLDYRCVAIHLPGFGGRAALDQPSLQAYADDVCQELARLEIEDYILIGHSMGGKIALQIAASCDRTPSQIILVAPSPPTQEPMPAEEKERLLNNHPSRDNAKTTVTNATQQSLRSDQHELAIQTHVTVDNSAWRWWLLDGMNHSIADQVAQISVPLTVIASEDDPVIPFDTIQSDVLDILPDADLITTQQVGHLIPLEAADWLANQLRAIAA